MNDKLKKCKAKFMEIRYLTYENYHELIELWRKAGLSSRPTGRDSYKSIKAEMVTNPEGFIGLFDKELLIGFILATYDGRKGWINRLAIDPDYRRQGLALRMINEAERVLKQRGARIIACLIEDWNTSSLAVFEKAGFAIHPDILYLTRRESVDV